MFSVPLFSSPNLPSCRYASAVGGQVSEGSLRILVDSAVDFNLGE